MHSIGFDWRAHSQFADASSLISECCLSWQLLLLLLFNGNNSCSANTHTHTKLWRICGFQLRSFRISFFFWLGILYLNYLIRITTGMWYTETESLLWSVHKTSRLHLFGWIQSYAIRVSVKRVKHQVRVSTIKCGRSVIILGNFRRKLRRTPYAVALVNRCLMNGARKSTQLRAQQVTRIFHFTPWHLNGFEKNITAASAADSSRTSIERIDDGYWLGVRDLLYWSFAIFCSITFIKHLWKFRRPTRGILFHSTFRIGVRVSRFNLFAARDYIFYAVWTNRINRKQTRKKRL